MSDYAWPNDIKPLISKNYSTSRGANVVATPVTSGLPRQGLNTTLESPPFNLNFSLTNLEMQVLLSFYDGPLNHGANSFKMNLDSGMGIEEHQCKIVPGTWNPVKPNNGRWYLALTVVAEVTSSQLDTSTAVYDLYAVYGTTLPAVLAGLQPIIDEMPDA